MVYEQHIAIVDAEVAHRITRRAHEERSLRVSDQNLIEVDAVDGGVAAGIAEAGRARGSGRRGLRPDIATEAAALAGEATTGHLSSIVAGRTS
jgi:hypothetical protein